MRHFPHGASASFFLSKLKRAFILLEVMVTVVILGVAAAAFMRTFLTNMHAARKMEIALRASLLAQATLERYELFPPLEGEYEGAFAEDPDFGPLYENYFWFSEIERVSIDYEEVELEGLGRDLVDLTQVHLKIIYDDGKNRRYTPVDRTTFLLEFDPFSNKARSANLLF